MMRWRLILAAAAIAFAGCAGVGDRVDGALDEIRPGAQHEVFYAATDGLAIHAAASSSSPVVGRLARHAKVTRTRVEGGYAHIAADGRRPAGWVVNAQLLWRLPAAGHEAAPAADTAPAPAEAAEPASEATEAATPPTPEPTGTAAEEPAVATPDPAPAADPPPAPVRRPRPGSFDPF